MYEEKTVYSFGLIVSPKQFLGLAVAAKSLFLSANLQESMTSSFDILLKLGENPLRDLGSRELNTDLQKMNSILKNTTDDFILSMPQNQTKQLVTTLNLYINLGHVLRFVKPSLIGDLARRMVELTLINGIVDSSPQAFAYYGGVLVAAGNVTEGCRLGRLALKLVEERSLSKSKSAVIGLVYLAILWTSEPLQSTAHAHDIGRKVGQQSGDYLYTRLVSVLL